MAKKNLPWDQRKPKKNPCNSSPKAPTGVAFQFTATEALTHLRFDGKIKWNEVTQDQDGFPTQVELYDIAYLACDSGGTPLEIEDTKTRFREGRKVPVSHVGITAATTVANVATFTTAREHGFIAGDKVTVADMTPSAYNGNWTVISAPTTTSFTANIGSTPGDGTDFGRALDNDDSLHIITGRVPKPKTWYWKARVRAQNRQGCWGPWSAWTTPALPWSGADPAPPAPTFGATPITFERIGVGKKRRFRLKFTFNEVVDWDVPGGDRESDMRAYTVVVDRSDDGSSWDGTPWFRHRYVMAKQDADADTTRTVAFEVPAKQWYRCKVRSIDRYGRHGAFSSFTDAALPNDNTQPPRPNNVRIFDTATNRIVLDFDEPTANYPTRGTVSGSSGTATLTGTNTKFTVEIEAGSTVRVDSNNYVVKKVTSDTALTLTTNLSTSPSNATLYLVEEHYDVTEYELQIAKSADVNTAPTPDEWSAVYAKHKTQGTRGSFKVPVADEGLTFYGRVRSLDMARNKSKWVYATYAGNSDPDVSGQGVTIGKGGGKTKIPFSIRGRLRILAETESHELDIDEAMTINKWRCRVRQAPTGSGATFKLWKNNTTLVSTVTIAAGSKRQADDTLNVAVADGDSLSIEVTAVGSTFPGKHYTGLVVMS